MDCFYLIDKPIGITSYDIIRKLKKTLNQKRIWHTWTLDPLATGLVLIAVWNYTKLIPYLENRDKSYEFKIMLDWKSESYDLWTQVNFISKEKQKNYKNKISKEIIKDILENNFLWEIEQIPPKYSAIKIWWKKALFKIKDWEDFEIKSRKVNIKEIEILDYNFPEIHLKAKVSEWTYIRSIAADLWEIIWTWWYISYLRRTKIWNLEIDFSQELDVFEIENKLSEDKLFPKERFINLDEDTLFKINQWKEVETNIILENEERYFNKNDLWITNIIEYNNNIFKPLRKIL